MADTHPRRQRRLRGWDYSQPGSYFITICTINSADLLGDVAGGRVRLNAYGEIAKDTWAWLGAHFPNVSLDESVVMPNHIHDILVLTTAVRGQQREASDMPVHRKTVGELVGAFKTRSTKEVNRLRQTPGAVLWQRDFWDRVIRNEYELTRTREYIRRNPEKYRARVYKT